eukprot:6737428-Alexandrium_andersonii.AAC.2
MHLGPPYQVRQRLRWVRLLAIHEQATGCELASVGSRHELLPQGAGAPGHEGVRALHDDVGVRLVEPESVHRVLLGDAQDRLYT